MMDCGGSPPDLGAQLAEAQSRVEELAERIAEANADSRMCGHQPFTGLEAQLACAQGAFDNLEARIVAWGVMAQVTQ